MTTTFIEDLIAHKSPILSICIPTFNRSTYLRDSLQSIVNQEVFANFDFIEVVVQDNKSTDDTLSVAHSFSEKWPNKIVVFQNSFHSSADENFVLAMQNAKGNYIKLSNDYIIYNDKSLRKILNHILENLKSQRNLYFVNDEKGIMPSLQGHGKASFLREMSFACTWIGVFGIWKSTFDSISNPDRNVPKKLNQVDLIYRSLDRNPEFMIVADKFFSFNSKSLGVRKDYDLLTIFLDNYFEILLSHFQCSNIQPREIEDEKSKILLNYICGWAVRAHFRLEASCNINNHWRRVWIFCKNQRTLFFKYLAKYLYNYIKILINGEALGKIPQNRRDK